jgi:adenylosuccinate synthase
VYADKAARVGIRAGDLLEPAFLKDRIPELTRRASAAMDEPISVDQVSATIEMWTERLGPMVADTHPLVQAALRRDARIILEGHLGVMRDLDWGLYPYVTSSTCLAGGACAGAGIPPQRIGRVIGVVKAYTTAVGAGPMPTELHDATGALLRERGQEYGTSTSRPRRCGWFDAVAARFAAEVSGFTDLAVMKLDVLDGFETVRIGVAYRDGARRLETVPHTAVMGRVTPVYEDLPGWSSTSEARSFHELAPAARAFLDRIAALAAVPVSIVGVGRDREALIADPAGLGVAV